jgi:integrase
MIFDDLKTLLNYARRDLEWTVRNPWEGLNIEYETEDERDPWTAEQLQAFFGQPLFTKYKLPKTTMKSGGSAAYWVPLLGLFTGARIGELCQLRTVDIVERDGIPCIDINKKAPGAKLKNKSAARLIPIHPELVRLGFLEYVECLRKVRTERLWPSLGGTDPGSYFSGWFSSSRSRRRRGSCRCRRSFR